MNAPLKIAIVDYDMSNVLNVQRACSYVGMEAFVSSDKNEILNADAAILPGVGAFGDAMRALEHFNLITTLYKFVEIGKPLFGICLGMQLLMTKSYEFGTFQGLNLIPGEVIFFKEPKVNKDKILKVPQVQWNRIYRSNNQTNYDQWNGTIFEGIQDGEFMYFVHSLYVIPDDFSVCLAKSKYGDVEFCCGLQYKNIFACQFHPEKSGISGLNIYQNFKNFIIKNLQKGSEYCQKS